MVGLWRRQMGDGATPLLELSSPPTSPKSCLFLFHAKSLPPTREIASDRDFSDETAAAIDEEVRSLVEQAYRRAKDVLFNNRHILDRLAQMLIEKETVDSEELQIDFDEY